MNTTKDTIMNPSQQSKHTPGPWFRGPSDEGEKILIAVCENPDRLGEPTGLVAEVNKRICFTAGSDPMESEVAEANARLIAAAPELLRACTELFYALEGTPQAHLRHALSSVIDRAQD